LIAPGSRVTFTRHINGLVHTVVTRDGDDCSIQDPRGRVLRNVPVEDLQLAPPTELPIREVDGFQ
jgi:hypothetical protein